MTSRVLSSRFIEIKIVEYVIATTSSRIDIPPHRTDLPEETRSATETTSCEPMTRRKEIIRNIVVISGEAAMEVETGAPQGADGIRRRTGRGRWCLGCGCGGKRVARKGVSYIQGEMASRPSGCRRRDSSGTGGHPTIDFRRIISTAADRYQADQTFRFNSSYANAEIYYQFSF